MAAFRLCPTKNRVHKLDLLANITKVPQNVFTLGSETVDCSTEAKIDESNIAELLKFAN